MARLRAVLDTNVLVSGLAYPGSVPGRIVSAWRQGGLEVVLSHDILDELVRVLPRLPRIRMSSAEIRDLVDSLMFLADVVDPTDVRDARLRDPSDQPVLGDLAGGEGRLPDHGRQMICSCWPAITPSSRRPSSGRDTEAESPGKRRSTSGIGRYKAGL
jgi:hypothetical protein